VQELPVSKPGEKVLKFALTLSLPVFVAPDNEIINWTAGLGVLGQENLPVKVTNNGNRHVMVSKIKATGVDASGAEIFTQEATGWYTLSGKTRSFPVNIPHQECLKAARINVVIETKESNKEMDFDVNKAMCTRKPEAVTKTGKTVPSMARP
jgi:P pilus assembly chaperone PapD